MSTTRPKGLLSTPELHKPDKQAFDTRPKHIDAWLEELPLGDTGECARRIYVALKEVNKLDISKNARLHVLNVLSSPAYDIFQTLKRHYVNQTLPLSDKNRNIAQLAIALNSEFATGYKIIVEQSWTKNLSLFNRKSITEVIHHAMYYLSNMLLASYQIYADQPQNAWIQIHQLYLFAEENTLHKTVVKNKDSNKKLPQCSIEDLYKQIVMLALISPYRIRQKIVDQLYYALLKWSEHCAILPAEDFSEDSHHIRVRLNSDTNPGLFGDKETANRIQARTFDTSTIVHMLSESLLDESRTTLNSEFENIPDDVIKLIILTWSGKSKRAFSRTTANNTLTLTIGLSGTHDLISELIRLNPDLQLNGGCESATTAVIDPNLTADTLAEIQNPKIDAPAEFDQPMIFGASDVKEFAKDVWSTDYASKTIGYDYNLRLWYEQKEKEMNQGQSSYEPYSCNNINESAGGYCLVGQLEAAATTAKVQIGELAGIRDTITTDGNTIGIGVIRRIKNMNKGLELGIQKLAPCAEIVAVSRYSVTSGQDRFVRALVLPELKSITQPVTLLTHNMFKVNDHLMINKYGFKTHVKLTKLLQSTGVFSQFEFSQIEVLGYQSEADSKPGQNEFDDVWTLI